MRSGFLASLPLFVLIGCDDRKPTPPGIAAGSATALAKPSDVDPGGPPPTTPVAGLIKGKPFTPDQVLFERTTLSFRKGKDFFPDMEIKVDVPKQDGENLEGKEWKAGGDQFGPFVVVSFKEGKDFPTTEPVQPSDYKLTLRITKQSAKSVEGTIDLHINKPANTHLSGVFTATVKKTALDPLDADDAPYVQGKISIAGDWTTEQISAGFGGKGTDGKPNSNSVGSKISAGSPTWMTNESFKPQLTSLTYDAKAGLVYRHTHVPPGEYWVFARRGGVMAAWKKVAVKAGDQLTVNLAIDLSRTGELEVTLPDEEAKDKQEWHLSLIPAEIESPGPGWSYVFNAAEVKTGQKTVTVKGVPAGKFRAIRGMSEGEVEVVAGQTAKVALTRRAPAKE